MSAAETTCSFCRPSLLHVGDIALLCGKPCKIVQEATCKTGKHGGCKYIFVGLDLFTQKKYENFYMDHQQVSVPETHKTKYQILEISDDGYFSLLTPELEIREDLKVPADGDMLLKVKTGQSYAVVLNCMGIEEVVDILP